MFLPAVNGVLTVIFSSSHDLPAEKLVHDGDMAQNIGTNVSDDTHTQSQRYLSTRGADENVGHAPDISPVMLRPLNSLLTLLFAVFLRGSRPQGSRLRWRPLRPQLHPDAQQLGELEGSRLPPAGLRDPFSIHLVV